MMATHNLDADQSSPEPAASSDSLNSRSRLEWITLVIFSHYFIFQLFNYFSPKLVPDEVWFLKVAGNFSKLYSLPFSYFQIPSELLYGSFYWLLQMACFRAAELFGIPEYLSYLPIRTAAFICILLPILCIFLVKDTGQRPYSRWPALFIWLALPVAWWTGKISGPETFSYCVALTGIYFYDTGCRTQTWLPTLFGGLLCGLAAGIKLSAVPLILGGAILTLKWRAKFRYHCIFLFGAIAGVFFGNPHLHSEGTMKLSLANLTRKQVMVVLWNDEWLWDAVYNGGFFRWGLSAAALAGFLIILLVNRQRLVAAAVISSYAAGILMCFTAPIFFGWYAFGPAYMLPFAAQHLPATARNWTAILCIVVISLFENVTVIRDSISLKIERNALWFKPDQIVDEVAKCIPSNFGGTVDLIDFTDAPTVLDENLLRTRVKIGKSIKERRAILWIDRSVIPPLKPPYLIVIGSAVTRPAKPAKRRLKELLPLIGNNVLARCSILDGDIIVVLADAPKR